MSAKSKSVEEPSSVRPPLDFQLPKLEISRSTLNDIIQDDLAEILLQTPISSQVENDFHKLLGPINSSCLFLDDSSFETPLRCKKSKIAPIQSQSSFSDEDATTQNSLLKETFVMKQGEEDIINTMLNLTQNPEYLSGLLNDLFTQPPPPFSMDSYSQGTANSSENSGSTQNRTNITENSTEAKEGIETFKDIQEEQYLKFISQPPESFLLDSQPPYDSKIIKKIPVSTQPPLDFQVVTQPPLYFHSSISDEEREEFELAPNILYRSTTIEGTEVDNDVSLEVFSNDTKNKCHYPNGERNVELDSKTSLTSHSKTIPRGSEICVEFQEDSLVDSTPKINPSPIDDTCMLPSGIPNDLENVFNSSLEHSGRQEVAIRPAVDHGNFGFVCGCKNISDIFDNILANHKEIDKDKHVLLQTLKDLENMFRVPETMSIHLLYQSAGDLIIFKELFLSLIKDSSKLVFENKDAGMLYGNKLPWTLSQDKNFSEFNFTLIDLASLKSRLLYGEDSNYLYTRYIWLKNYKFL